MDNGPPDLELIASQTAQERDAQHHLWRVERAARELTANLIRIVRGAGRPHDFVDHIVELHGLFASAPEGLTVFQVNEGVGNALNQRNKDDRHDRFEVYIRDIEEGALRAVAARLLNQHAQAAKGRADLWDAFYALENYREREAEKWRGSFTERRKARKAPAKQKVIAEKPKAKPAASRSVEIEKLPGESTADFMRRLSESE